MGDQHSTRSSFSEGLVAGGAAAAAAGGGLLGALPGPLGHYGHYGHVTASGGDPLARWFEEHYRLLLAAGE